MPIIKTSNPDLTEIYTTQSLHSVQIQSPPGDAVRSDQYVDELTACQYGLASILNQIEFRSVDRRALLNAKKVEARSFKFERIYLDWPDPEDNLSPGAPTALIKEADDTSYDGAPDMPGTSYEDDTLDCFGAGTVLRKYGEASIKLIIECVIPNKDDRSAVRKGIVQALSAEPLDDRPGRRVIIKNYYNKSARYMLRSIKNIGDEPDKAKARMTGLVVSVEATIVLVGLVAAPGTYQPLVGVRVHGSDPNLT